MRLILLVVLAGAVGTAPAQGADRPSALDPRAKVPPVEFRSALEGYRPFVDPEMRNWRRSNDEVANAGGHAGHGAGQPTSKPEPGKPESAGGPAEKSRDAPAHEGDGGHR